MSTIKHKEAFTVRSYELDSHGRATLPVIANYFQEAAGKNARDLKFDIRDLHKKGVTWVLYRMHINIDRFPERWQDVIVNTWPSSGDGIRAFRDYELTDADGNKLGAGISQWMVLNMKNRRPARIPKEILEMGLEVDEHQLPIDKEPFPDMKKADRTARVVVGRHHLDMNRHVNNVAYIEWMTGFMPESLDDTLVCRELKIQYHKECGLNQELRVKTERLEDNSFLHRIEDITGHTTFAEGVSVWDAVKV